MCCPCWSAKKSKPLLQAKQNDNEDVQQGSPQTQIVDVENEPEIAVAAEPSPAGSATDTSDEDCEHSKKKKRKKKKKKKEKKERKEKKHKRDDSGDEHAEKNTASCSRLLHEESDQSDKLDTLPIHRQMDGLPLTGRPFIRKHLGTIESIDFRDSDDEAEASEVLDVQSPAHLSVIQEGSSCPAESAFSQGELSPYHIRVSKSPSFSSSTSEEGQAAEAVLATVDSASMAIASESPPAQAPTPIADTKDAVMPTEAGDNQHMEDAAVLCNDAERRVVNKTTSEVDLRIEAITCFDGRAGESSFGTGKEVNRGELFRTALTRGKSHAQQLLYNRAKDGSLLSTLITSDEDVHSSQTSRASNCHCSDVPRNSGAKRSSARPQARAGLRRACSATALGALPSSGPVTLTAFVAHAADAEAEARRGLHRAGTEPAVGGALPSPVTLTAFVAAACAEVDGDNSGDARSLAVPAGLHSGRLGEACDELADDPVLSALPQPRGPVAADLPANMETKLASLRKQMAQVLQASLRDGSLEQTISRREASTQDAEAAGADKSMVKGDGLPTSRGTALNLAAPRTENADVDAVEPPVVHHSVPMVIHSDRARVGPQSRRAMAAYSALLQEARQAVLDVFMESIGDGTMRAVLKAATSSSSVPDHSQQEVASPHLTAEERAACQKVTSEIVKRSLMAAERREAAQAFAPTACPSPAAAVDVVGVESQSIFGMSNDAEANTSKAERLVVKPLLEDRAAAEQVVCRILLRVVERVAAREQALAVGGALLIWESAAISDVPLNPILRAEASIASAADSARMPVSPVEAAAKQNAGSPHSVSTAASTPEKRERLLPGGTDGGAALEQTATPMRGAEITSPDRYLSSDLDDTPTSKVRATPEVARPPLPKAPVELQPVGAICYLHGVSFTRLAAEPGLQLRLLTALRKELARKAECSPASVVAALAAPCGGGRIPITLRPNKADLASSEHLATQLLNLNGQNRGVETCLAKVVRYLPGIGAAAAGFLDVTELQTDYGTPDGPTSPTCRGSSAPQPSASDSDLNAGMKQGTGPLPEGAVPVVHLPESCSDDDAYRKLTVQRSPSAEDYTKLAARNTRLRRERDKLVQRASRVISGMQSLGVVPASPRARAGHLQDAASRLPRPSPQPGFTFALPKDKRRYGSEPKHDGLG
eukprot:TRINITY_DN15423_c0_g1_i1.p1 TRINITY_DN15423_c0_g1~~TRINITY_DN15423_c0_g1_i1.p1  ORF type:complete len:1172 (-),score=217.21 TRINITY_DN15423_c0_g1_i1:45-3560(-)